MNERECKENWKRAFNDKYLLNYIVLLINNYLQHFHFLFLFKVFLVLTHAIRSHNK